MRKFIIALSTIAVFTVAQLAEAQTATFTKSTRAPTAAEIGNDAALGAAGMTVNEYFVTTTSDILQFDQVNITASPLYQNATGSNTDPPLPALVAVLPALGADTWITTPADPTSLAGGGFGDPASSWFDSTDSGPQNNFKFAQLTSVASGAFQGRIFLKGDAGPVILPFDLVVGTTIVDPNNTAPVITDDTAGTRPNRDFTHQFLVTDAETPSGPFDWSVVSFTGPTVPANFSLNPTTGLFSWDTTGVPNGSQNLYTLTVQAADQGPGDSLSDTGTLLIRIPEPGTCVLAGLSLIGVFASRRRLS